MFTVFALSLCFYAVYLQISSSFYSQRVLAELTTVFFLLALLAVGWGVEELESHGGEIIAFCHN